MSTTPTPPDEVAVGQIWRTNDHRTLGAGEFVIEAIETKQIRGGQFSRHEEPHAVVLYRESGRRVRIRVGRILGSAHRQRGFTYLGMSR